jgi:integrase
MRKRGLPPGGRKTSAGRITITIRVAQNGETKRLAHSKVKPDEPTTYATEAEAWAGYERVIAFIDDQADSVVTLGAFWEEWTDEDHYLWGTIKGRSRQTIASYTTRTRRFVKMYRDRPIDSIVELDVHRYLKAGGKPSTLYTISTMFHDAASQKLITAHPCAQLAAEAEAAIRKARERKRKQTTLPDRETLTLMLERAKQAAYPPGLWAWLVVGAETGMRGGELDGMEWEFLKGNRYEIRWQWNRAIGEMSEPKHGSTRDLLLSPRAMAAIETCRGNGSRYIFLNNERTHWNHDSRARWWEWCADGGAALRQIVGGVTMYESTRHAWASWAVNDGGLSPYQASLLYGHTDGGKLITETYAKPDHEAAMRAALEAAKRADVPNLDDKRQAS